MRYLSIKSFEELQHYKDWQPPWIKLYNRLLDDYAFLQLSETAQIHLVKLWLLASRHDNRIPNDLVYISRAIQAKTAVDLDEMIVAGFVVPTDSAPRHKRRRRTKIRPAKVSRPNLDSVKRKSTVETETETETKRTRAKRGGWVSDWGQDWEESTKGIAPFGEIGRYGKPIVEREGEGPARAAWRIFVASPDVRFGPSYFSKHFGNYTAKPKLVASNGVRSGMIEW